MTWRGTEAEARAWMVDWGPAYEPAVTPSLREDALADLIRRAQAAALRNVAAREGVIVHRGRLLDLADAIERGEVEP